MMSMRPNKIGYGLVAFFFFAGLAFAIASKYTRLLGSIWVVVAVGLFILYRRMEGNVKRQIDFRKFAIPAKARIINFTDTGVTVNMHPVLKISLEIQAEGLAPYPVEMKTRVPRAAVGQMTAGGLLTAWVDRKDHQKVQVDWATPSGAMAGVPSLAGVSAEGQSFDLRNNPAARAAVIRALKEQGIDLAHDTAAADPTTPIEKSTNPTTRIQKLRELKAVGLITETEFEEQKKRVLEDI
jgi:hypothetical protein